MTAAVEATLACPLCGAAGTPVQAISYDEIWDSYASEFGHTLSTAVKARHTPAAEATMRVCDGCRLHFFTPKAPGDEDFYSELISGIGYVPHRWAFEAVQRRLKDVSSLIDVGCGSGVFLQSIDVARTVGIDRNPDVHAGLSAYGIELHDNLATLAAREPAAFDVVCAFEVLEHVDDVASIMQAARAALKPGGRIFISVPNIERARAAGREPLDLPPHHISRWHASHGGVLADRFDLHLVRVDREPRLWGGVVSRLPRLRGLLGTPAGHACLRAVGTALKRGQHGHSLLFELRAPPRPRRPIGSDVAEATEPAPAVAPPVDRP